MEQEKAFVQTQIVLTRENNEFLERKKKELNQGNKSNVINIILDIYRKKQEN